MDDNKTPEVEACSQRVLEHPDDATAYLHLGQALRDCHRRSEAIKAFAAAATLDFDVGWYELAFALEEDGDASGAMRIWKGRLAFLDGMPAGLIYAGKSTVKLPQRVKQMLAVGEHAAEAERLLARGDITGALAEYKTAVARWSMAHRIHPS